MSRIAIIIVIAVVVMNAATALFAKSVPSKNPKYGDTNLTVIYVGAEDCAPCIIWKNEHREAFLASPQYAKITYHEVIAEKTADALTNKAWPKELRQYRDGTKRLFGAPSWLVVENHRVIASIGGLSNWKKHVFPFLQNSIRIQ